MSNERGRGENKDRKRNAEERKIQSGKVQGNPQQSTHSRKFQSEGQQMIVKKEKIPQQRVQGVPQQSTAIESKIRENAYRKRNTKKEDRVSVGKCIDKDIHY